MNIAIYSGEKGLSELTRRVFHLPAKTPSSELNRAEDALIRANPALHDLKQWSEGAPLLVPDLAGLQSTEQGTLFDLASQPITNEASRALTEIRSAMNSAADQNLAAAEDVLKLVKQKDLKHSSTAQPEIKTRLDQITNATKDRQTQLKTVRAAYGKVFSGL